MPFSVAALAQAKAFRISPKDTNYFVMLFDQATDAINNIFVVEIFRPGGATPPNEHAAAHEFFHVLHGEGIARCDGKTLPIRKGDSLLLHPGSEHVIENTGAGKLYTLDRDDAERRLFGINPWRRSGRTRCGGHPHSRGTVGDGCPVTSRPGQ